MCVRKEQEQVRADPDACGAELEEHAEGNGYRGLDWWRADVLQGAGLADP